MTEERNLVNVLSLDYEHSSSRGGGSERLNRFNTNTQQSETKIPKDL